MARIATLAGLLFTAVAALAAIPRSALATGGAVALTVAAILSLAAAWIAATAAPASVPVPLRIRGRRPAPPSHD